MSGVLRRALAGYFVNDCPLAAAAIAYYLLLSIFPLLLLIITVGSNLLPPHVVQRQVLEVMNQYVAGSRSTLRSVVAGVEKHSTSLSLLALVGLVWSGMGIFGALRMALNQAWGVRESRSFLVQRRLEISFALLVGTLFFASTLITWGIDVAIVPLDRRDRLAIVVFRFLAGALIALAGFTLSYELLPDFAGRTWRASFAAGGVATLLFEVAKWLFVVYVSGFANFSLVYGALGSVIVFLVWAYALASILLFCGQLARELAAPTSAAAVPVGNI